MEKLLVRDVEWMGGRGEADGVEEYSFYSK